MEILNRIKSLWLEKIQLAADYKQREFTRTADECMTFYDGPADFMYGSSNYLTLGGGGAQNVVEPWKRMTVNKTSEMVDVYIPYLYHQNPTRNCKPRIVDIPPEILINLIDPQQMMLAQQQAIQMGVPFDPMSMIPRNPNDPIKALKAALIQWVLNYTPNELDLKGESRKGLVEALIKGRGLAWTEVFQGPQGRLVGSFFESVDNLFMDPDAEHVRDCGWGSRRRRLPVHVVERMYPHIPAGGLRRNRDVPEYPNLRAVPDLRDDLRRESSTHEEIVIHEIYSRCGAGGYLAGASGEMRDTLGALGDNVFLVVSEDYEFPLNMTPSMFEGHNAEMIVRESVTWPTPFHEDKMSPWPFSELDFHYRPRKVWPKAHMKAALGEQRFLNWAYTFLARKMRTTTRDLWLIDKAVEEEFMEALSTGGDDMIVPVRKGSREWDAIVHVLQAPDPPRSLVETIQMMERNFEMRTGVNELLSRGDTQAQMRSAQEASVKREMTQIRPEDMANLTADWQSAIARKEAIASRRHYQGQDVAAIFGETFQPSLQLGQLGQVGYLTQLWQKHVASSDINEIVAEFDYRIESSSMRKPNVAQEISSIDESAQTVVPILMQSVQQTGDWGPLNRWLEKWAQSRNWDPGTLKISPPPPVPQMPAPAGPQPQGQPQAQQGPPNRVFNPQPAM